MHVVNSSISRKVTASRLLNRYGKTEKLGYGKSLHAKSEVYFISTHLIKAVWPFLHSGGAYFN